MQNQYVSRLKRLSALPLLAILGGCNAVVLNPSGDVALQQRNLVIISVVLMLLIIVPVMALMVLFAWRYRAGNQEKAVYEPDWAHSTKLELVIWSCPLLIIICLGAVTWLNTHTLDPYQPLSRLDASQKVNPAVKPLVVDVVAMDWKWLFIYPEYGIATVNQVAAPVDRPIQFKITASSVMNSFYIPALAGQIYAMPGMETQLNAVINKAGDFKGFSANYSGAGFAGMHFRFLGLSQNDFNAWIAKARTSTAALDRAAYLKLKAPSENVPVMRFGSVATGLYDAALNMCVQPGQPCLANQMRADAVMDGRPMPMAKMPVAVTPANDAAADRPIMGAGLVSPAERSKSPTAAKLPAANRDTARRDGTAK